MNNYFKNKVVVITGAALGIGKCIKEEFEKLGAKTAIIDILENDYFVGDIGNKEILEKFSEKVIKDFGHVDFLINNAKPKTVGLTNGTYEDFEYSLSVGITAPFYLTKLFDKYFSKEACIINISSSRDRMSQKETESYTASKGGIAALTHALAVTLSNRVRVNSISPGWIDTTNTVYSGPDATQHPAGRVGNPLDIANIVVYLCSDKASFITGENICVDGGMTKQMVYHDDHGWTYNK